jgi:D-alanyl-D-alanine-carboxypeptidase/D-alanyl-D-alanine-endopeptidase
LIAERMNCGITSRLRAGVFALTLAASTAVAAQGHFPSDEAIRELARQAGTVSGKVGMVIGVLEADGTRRVITVGDAPYDGQTLFEIGSITKVFTGILLAEMAERGEVRLEQPVAELLPGDVVVPSRNGRQIRLVDLSTHSSGLPRMPDNFNPGGGNPYAHYTVAQLYDFLRRHELRRDIGVESEYSNVGVGLLGHALARRAGSSYEALVTARILGPLGMTSTRITLSPADVARLAPGHNERGQQVPNWDLAEAFAGAGALRSNVDDMLTFLAANLRPADSSTLGRAMRRAQATHFTGVDGRKGSLGWGRSLSLLLRERNVLAHAGGTGGYLTFVAVDPERRLGVVVLSNQVPEVSQLGLHLLDTRVPVSLAPVERPLRVLPVISALVLIAGVFVAWRRTGASRLRSILAAAGMTLGLIAWMATTYVAPTVVRVLQLPPGPPTMVVVVVLVLVLSVGLGVSPVGLRLAAGVPLAVLVGVQAFRLPLALLMHRAYEYGLMPVQMSYRGLNFDIVTGITAIIVVVLLATGSAGVRTVRAWNVMGTLLLVNIVLIGWLSAPTPWRVFRDGPADVWITTVPYIWLPTMMVACAILGHIVIYRRLRIEGHRIRVASQLTL